MTRKEHKAYNYAAKIFRHFQIQAHDPLVGVAPDPREVWDADKCVGRCIGALAAVNLESYGFEASLIACELFGYGKEPAGLFCEPRDGSVLVIYAA
jgi:hypothetical protein